MLYPDGIVQHAGLVLGLHLFGMVYNRVSDDYHDEFGSPNIYRNLLAIMGACQMVSRVAFDAVGGFDERYRIAKSDSILCLRNAPGGLANGLHSPFAALFHHEGYTRGKLNPIEDLERAAREIRENRHRGRSIFSSGLELTSGPTNSPVESGIIATRNVVEADRCFV